MYKYMAVAIICLALSIIAYSISGMYQAGLKAIGTNPEVSDQVQGLSIIAASFMEFLGLLCFVLAYLNLTL